MFSGDIEEDQWREMDYYDPIGNQCSFRKLFFFMTIKEVYIRKD